MYVTRPLSQYLADPNAAAEPPPEGPGSGFLVVVDETGETARTRCWGLCVDREMRGLPFPQNRQLALRPNTSPDTLESCATFVDCLSEVVGSLTDVDSGSAPGSKAAKIPDYAMLVPVIGQPLSSGRYYVVKADGKYRGMVSACSKEEDKTTCCCCFSCINDVKPRSFDRGDVYQQVEVQQLPSGNKGFKAVAVATDGIPPDYLRKKGWKVNTMKSPEYDLTADAQGVDSALRRQMPDLESLSIGVKNSSPVVVGKWYVPFMFVKADSMFVKAGGCFVKSDGKLSLKDQSRKCMFYEMTMEQSWEKICSREAEGTNHPAEVVLTATVRRSTVVLDGTRVVPREDSGAVWFEAAGDTTTTLGLDMVVWERMRWELERGDYWVAPVNGDEERIERVERCDGLGQWHKFACYVLVERFVLKRMDGSLALTCEFRHTDKIKAKWL
uniref:Uncharacterized protein n=1 Tax=Avena sativa TaxID=4498 RepID=A0ACD5YEL3_AVESA